MAKTPSPDLIEVCHGPTCNLKNPKHILQKAAQSNPQSAVAPCVCLGNCHNGVNVKIDKKQIIQGVTTENIEQRLDVHSKGTTHRRSQEENIELDDKLFGDSLF